MKKKSLYWCPFCQRNVSLWGTKDGQLICPRCGREILKVTGDGRIVAIKGKGSLEMTEKSTSEQIERQRNG